MDGFIPNIFVYTLIGNKDNYNNLLVYSVFEIFTALTP